MEEGGRRRDKVAALNGSRNGTAIFAGGASTANWKRKKKKNKISGGKTAIIPNIPTERYGRVSRTRDLTSNSLIIKS